MVVFTDGVADLNSAVTAANNAKRSLPGLRLIAMLVGDPEARGRALLREITTDDDYIESRSEESIWRLAYRLSSEMMCDTTGVGSSLTCLNGNLGREELNTGWDPDSRSIKSTGRDPRWKVDPPNELAYLVAPVDVPGNAWPKLPAAEWISPSPTRQGGSPTYKYARTFVVPGSSASAYLDMYALADDTIKEIRLNNTLLQQGQSGVWLEGSGCYCTGYAKHVLVSDPSRFVPGTNTIEFTVSDTGGMTGFTARGYVATCSGGAVSVLTATPSPTATPTKIPSPSPTPAPTHCSIGDETDGANIQGGTAGATYVCVSLDSTLCETREMFVSEAEVLRRHLRTSRAFAWEGTCTVCGGCKGAILCADRSRELAAVSESLAVYKSGASPSQLWDQYGDVEILLGPVGAPPDVRRWGMLAADGQGQYDYFIERYVTWTKVNGEVRVLDNGWGKNPAWARSLPNTYEKECGSGTGFPCTASTPGTQNPWKCPTSGMPTPMPGWGTAISPATVTVEATSTPMWPQP